MGQPSSKIYKEGDCEWFINDDNRHLYDPEPTIQDLQDMVNKSGEDIFSLEQMLKEIEAKNHDEKQQQELVINQEWYIMDDFEHLFHGMECVEYLDDIDYVAECMIDHDDEKHLFFENGAIESEKSFIQ